jgi:hypothetical protein
MTNHDSNNSSSNINSSSLLDYGIGILSLYPLLLFFLEAFFLVLLTNLRILSILRTCFLLRATYLLF